MKTMLAGFALVCSVVLSACGGGGPCDDLKKQCDACTNVTQKKACNDAYTSYKASPIGGDTLCKTAVDLKTWGADTTVCKVQ
jgi:hypothetical protein